MQDEIQNSELEQILDLFLNHDIDFIVVGGQAEVMFGSPRVTYDLDLCYRRTSDNLDRLAKALKVLKPTLRGAPADQPFALDSKSLALGTNFTFETPILPLDLLGWLEPIGTYEDLLENVETQPYKETTVNIIGLDDLIRIKEHINRPKDRDSLMQLRAIKQVRADRSIG